VKTKATKIDRLTWSYRGFEIKRSFISPHGTWNVCKTPQGYRVTPGGKSDGDWEPSIKDAVEGIDRLYARYFELSSQGKWIVIQAIRKLQEQRASKRIAVSQ
jgi:hypothetical protein